MGIVKTKRDLIDILRGVPKEAYERGPRPPLHHPDVIKAREEWEKKVKAEQTTNNSESVDS